MIAQYQAIKATHEDYLLFYRMGDFYELFFDDAIKAAPALDIALTRRGRHNDTDIPMCGVPVHNAENYLHRLIRAGFKVAICEQMEDPAEARKRRGNTLVRRDVVRIVTPGTITEDGLLEAQRNNFLAALARSQNELGLAWLDISTGTFTTAPVTLANLAAELARLDPGEILVAEAMAESPDLGPILADHDDRLTLLPSLRFDSSSGRRRLEEHYKIAAIDAFGAFCRAELGAAGALLDYVELTQKGQLPRLARPVREEAGSLMLIDAATRRNLELLVSLGGERRGSLVHAVDRTVTVAGGRLLAARLAAPLTSCRAIEHRLDAVAVLLDEDELRGDVRKELGACPDLERALSRLAIGRGGPRDLGAIRAGLERGAALKTYLAATAAAPLERITGELGGHEELIGLLGATLVDEPPHLTRDGGFIRGGADSGLDQARELRDQGRRHIAALEARYRDETAIATLKIRHNNMLGYFIEVTATHLSKVPDGFVQRQSMANATRFTTPELGELQSAIANAGERALALELERFETLRQAVLSAAESVARAAGALARLDVAGGFAELAAEQSYCRPRLTDGEEFAVEGGRHPVVEQALASQSGRFVGNDADLAPDQRLWLLTGPNMAGKSTFLRQNALIAVLAQCGSFVPASRAVIGVVDRLFSRVGAADDLARGRSTFMVEMVETAAILNRATPRSLVILDEIGRGTATYDGLSIAWAVLEYLHDMVRCRGLFATHYHELTALAAKLDSLSCHTMRVKEWKDEVIFLHEVGEGSADRSYGIHVARLAGLPPAVLERASEVLRHLEEGEAGNATTRLADDLPLFAAAAARPTAQTLERSSPVEDALRKISPDEVTPRQALELIFRLRDLLDD